MYRCQKGLSSEKPGFSSENPVPWVATTRWASASTIPPRMVEPAPPGPSPGAGPAGAGTGDHVLGDRVDMARLDSIDALAHGLGRRGTGPQPPAPAGPAPGAGE